MATLPTDPAQLLARVKVLGPRWVEHAAELGLSPEMIAELQAALAECGGAADEAYRLREAAQMATQTYYTAADRLYHASAAVVRTVRANGLNSGDPSYFITAGMDVPGPRRRHAPPPGQPTALRSRLESLGRVRLTWRSKNPRGVANVVYEVTRQVRLIDGTTDGPPKVLGLAGGSRTFTDATLPAGAASAIYQVHPIRGRQRGPESAPLIMQFGTSAASAARAKLAA